MIHVTANEAGRNKVFKDRLFAAIKLLIKEISEGTVSQKEIIGALILIMYFTNSRLKTQVVGGD